jgi:trimethyllysine dioxygenase
MFHLVQFDGVGGQTVVVDGLNVANQLKRNNPDAYDFFLKTPIPFHYIDKSNYLFQRKPFLKKIAKETFLE